MRAMSFAVLTFCALAPVAVGRTQTLDGAIDMHAHAAPDGTPRKLDALELARMAKAAGMRAIWIRSREFPLGDVQPDAIIETLPELLPILEHWRA